MPEGVLARIGDALAEATATLADAGCATPRLDAELLLAEALGVGREWLVREAHTSLPSAPSDRFIELVARRARREPVAYILGRKDFRRISLAVDPRVLIPRPETELLVEVSLSLPTGTTVVDVGTGSGAVALAVKDERPDLAVWGVDKDAGALAVARANAQRLGLEVHFAQANLLAGVSERFDAILANLPYVADGTVLEPEIRCYEPAPALFAGLDGLEAIRRLVGMLDGTRLVAFEVGAGQAEEVSRLLAGAGFTAVERMRDLAGYERVVVGRR